MFDEYTERVLEHVRSTRGHWLLTRVGMLRRVLGHWRCCPISSMKGAEVGEYALVADELGIPATVRRDIVCAADNCKTDDQAIQRLRAALLEAAGLSEKEEGRGSD